MISEIIIYLLYSLNGCYQNTGHLGLKFGLHFVNQRGFPCDIVVKNPHAVQEPQETKVDRIGKIPWRRPWQPALVFLPGESIGQRRLVGYSLQGHKTVGHD